MSILFRKPLTAQPQYPAPVASAVHSCLIPLSGVLQVRAGPAWTVVNSASYSPGVCVAGLSVRNSGTAYLQRTNPYRATGPLTVVLVFTPTSVAGAQGIWSLAPTAADAGPFVLAQRNGSDVRVLAGAAYQVTFTGIAVVGQPLKIAFSLSNIAAAAAGVALTVAINGVVKTAAFTNASSLATNEFLGSGYNGQALGHYGEFFSLQQYLPNAVASLSANPWQLLQPPDPLWANALSGTSTIYGSTSIYSALDVLNSAITNLTTASGSAVGSKDQLSAASTNKVSASASVMQASDGDGSALANKVSGAASFAQLADAFYASSGLSIASGGIAYLQKSDQLSASGTVGVSGSVLYLQPSDKAVAVSLTTISGQGVAGGLPNRATSGAYSAVLATVALRQVQDLLYGADRVFWPFVAGNENRVSFDRTKMAVMLETYIKSVSLTAGQTVVKLEPSLGVHRAAN